MKAKTWLTIWITVVISILIMNIWLVYDIDPFFHYHKPLIEDYFYDLNNQRSQNDGIVRHFDYDALITGTSMVENFKTSEMDGLFGTTSVKVPFSGGSYKEINDNVNIALGHKQVKEVVRGLDMGYFLSSWDYMRTELGQQPTYLYDNDYFNDVPYVLSRDTLFGRIYPMIFDRICNDSSPGITSFDDYSRWQERFDFGINTVCPDGITYSKYNGHMIGLSEEEKGIIKENVDRNIISTAEKYPNTEFYYFFTPYSIIFWKDQVVSGEIRKTLEAEKLIIEQILPYRNIHLFAFGERTDIITDLNNYKDSIHYASWINSLILKWMHDGKYQLTKDNYESYLNNEYDFYSGFDYESLNEQEDYEADLYAAALLNEELTGVEPKGVSIGSVDGDTHSVGVFEVNLSKGYNYLCFYERGELQGDPLSVCVFDIDGNLLKKDKIDAEKVDDREHLFVIDLSECRGKVEISFEGGIASHNGKNTYYDVCLY